MAATTRARAGAADLPAVEHARDRARADAGLVATSAMVAALRLRLTAGILAGVR